MKKGVNAEVALRDAFDLATLILCLAQQQDRYVLLRYMTLCVLKYIFIKRSVCSYIAWRPPLIEVKRRQVRERIL